jgi:hypothetical protein
MTLLASVQVETHFDGDIDIDLRDTGDRTFAQIDVESLGIEGKLSRQDAERLRDALSRWLDD